MFDYAFGQKENFKIHNKNVLLLKMRQWKLVSIVLLNAWDTFVKANFLKNGGILVHAICQMGF